MARTSESKESVTITFANSQVTAGRDVSVAGVQKETLIEGVGEGAVVMVGDGLSQSEGASHNLTVLLTEWQAAMEAKIDALSALLAEDRADLKETVAKIKVEVAKADQASPGRLERLLNSIAAMGTDILMWR